MKKKLFGLLLAALVLLCGCSESYEPYPAETAPELSSGGGLTIHYIDVGQADCALVECDGEFMLIDGGNVDDGQLVVSYLEQQGVEELHTVISTHAHEDHVGGLSSVLAVYPAQTVYSPTRTYSSRCFDDFMYYVDQQGLAITDPVPGDSFSLGSAQILILGPLRSYPEVNDTSIVCKVTYGDTSFLFTGDMEQEAENDLLEAGADLKADVLKVGHHGSNTSSGYRFLYEVEPEYGIISCGKDNDYMDNAGVTVLRTDTLGTIRAVSDGQEITFYWENQNAAPENAGPAQEQIFIGNKNSLLLHSQDCDGLPAEKNRVYFESYQQAIDEGFTPHGCLG